MIFLILSAQSMLGIQRASGLSEILPGTVARARSMGGMDWFTWSRREKWLGRGISGFVPFFTELHCPGILPGLFTTQNSRKCALF